MGAIFVAEIYAAVDSNNHLIWESFENLITDNQRALLRLFQNNGVLHVYKEGEQLLFQNTEQPGFFWLLKGVAKEVHAYENLHISGDFIGLQEMFDHQNFRIQLKFTAPTNQLLFVPQDQFLHQQRATPGLVIPLIKHIHAEVTQIETRMLNMSQSKLEKRLLMAFEMLQKRFGADADFWVPMRISIEDLAGMVGTTKITVSKKIKQLIEEGQLELDGSRFRIQSGAMVNT